MKNKNFESDLLNAGKMFSNIPNEFEPLRKDLFSLEFPSYMGIDERFIVTCDRPTVENTRKEVQWKNLSFWYKGKSSCPTLNVEFRDAIGNGVYAKLEAWQREHTDPSSGKGGYAATYKKELVLNMEDPTGAVMQRFILHGCFLQDLKGGSLDQSSDEIATVSFTLSYDNYDMEY